MLSPITVTATGVVNLGVGGYDQAFVNGMVVTLYGFTGSLYPQKKQALGNIQGFSPNYFNCAYQDANTGTAYSAGTPITADVAIAIEATGHVVALNVTDIGDGSFIVVCTPYEGSLGSVGGSSGGGAVTIADGADTTFGAKADAASTDSTSTNTAMSFFKGIVKILADVWDSTNHWLRVLVSGNVGGITRLNAPTVTVTASAYAAGNCWGGLITLTNALGTTNGATGAWSSLTLTMHTSTPPVLDLLLFNAQPAGTFTDKSAFPTMSAADNLLVSKRISIASTDWVTIGGSSYATIKIGGLPVRATTSGTMYAAYNVTSGTPTPAATTDFTNRFGFFTDQ